MLLLDYFAMKAWRWLNFWIPLGLGFLVAGIISDLPTDGWTKNKGVGWLIVMVGGLVLSFASIFGVGFLCGLLGRPPREMSELFGKGFERGSRSRGDN